MATPLATLEPLIVGVLVLCATDSVAWASGSAAADRVPRKSLAGCATP